MAERVVVEATGQARIVGQPRLPWIEPMFHPLTVEERMIAMIRARVMDPTAVVRIVTTC